MGIRTYSQLAKELEKIKNKALEETGRKAKELVENRIDTDVYKAYNPAKYERTYGLRDSLEVGPLAIRGNTSEVEIKHEPSSMGYNHSKFQHASKYWSPHIYTKYVAETVHDGTSGRLFGTPPVGARPYMDNAKDELDKGKYANFMKESLNGMGYKVK